MKWGSWELRFQLRRHRNGLVNEKDMLWNVWQWKRYALERLARREKGVLRAAHTYTVIIRECPPPPPPGPPPGSAHFSLFSKSLIWWLSVPPAPGQEILHPPLFISRAVYVQVRLYNQEYIVSSHSIIARDRPPARPEPSLHVNIGMDRSWRLTSARRTGSLTLDEESEGCLFLLSGRHDSMSDRIANHIAWASIFFFCAWDIVRSAWDLVKNWQNAWVSRSMRESWQLCCTPKLVYPSPPPPPPGQWITLTDKRHHRTWPNISWSDPTSASARPQMHKYEYW